MPNEFPTFDVPTQFGAVRVTVTSDATVTVQAGVVYSERYECSPLKINGVEIGMRYELAQGTGTRVQIADGWEISYSSARPDPLNWRRMNDMISDSARSKIRTGVLSAVIDFLRENADVLYAAGDVRRAQRVAAIESQIATKEREIAELREQLAVLVDA